MNIQASRTRLYGEYRMTKKLKVKNIEIETSEGDIISMSLDEAKELYSQLCDLFGPNFAPSIPVITESDPRRYSPRPIWCSAGTSGDC